MEDFAHSPRMYTYKYLSKIIYLLRKIGLRTS